MLYALSIPQHYEAYRWRKQASPILMLCMVTLTVGVLFVGREGVVLVWSALGALVGLLYIWTVLTVPLSSRAAKYVLPYNVLINAHP